MQKGFHWNINNFTTYVSALFITLAKNRGKNNLVIENVYYVLTKSPCQLLNSEIVIYKQVNFTALNVHMLLIKAQEEYHQLVTNK